MGKIAIQLCGATQLLFGVLGKRWEAMDDFMHGVVNESWVRPGRVKDRKIIKM